MLFLLFEPISFLHLFFPISPFSISTTARMSSPRDAVAFMILIAADGKKIYTAAASISPLLLHIFISSLQGLLQASVLMLRLSYPSETVLFNKITRNRIVLSFKDSPRKTLGRRPSVSLPDRPTDKAVFKYCRLAHSAASCF